MFECTNNRCPLIRPTHSFYSIILQHCFVGSVPSVSPPSETVELNRTSSVNLTCMVSGQAGLKMVWLKNGVSSLPQSDIYRSQYANGSVMSLLTLKHVKYKDRGTVFSCTAWYSSLSINSTRNVHLLVHGRCFCVL